MRSVLLVALPRGLRGLFLLALSLLPTSLLFGQFTPARAQSGALPEISVTSPTLVPTPAGQTASSVTVITAADLERDQRRTVPDALMAVPGLNVVQSGGPGEVTSVFMRGTNSNHTKILIDGIDVSDPSNPTRVFNLAHMLTSDIERIEVLRGPQSGLYGADAIGGVISITTKKGEGPPKVTGLIEGGSFGTFNQSAGVSGSQSIFNYSFNVAHFRADDVPVTPQRLLPPGRAPHGDFYDNTTLSTKMGADFNEYFTVNWVARYTDALQRFTGDSGFPAAPDARQSTQLVHQFFTRGEAVLTLFDGRFKNYFGVNYTDHWNWNKQLDPAVPAVTKGDRTKYDWRGVASVLPGQTVVVGLESDTERLRTDTLTAENSNKAGFIELQSEFQKMLFIVANARYDDNERFGGHSTYRVAPAFIVPVTETKLKASYGTGFKAPTLNQLFVDFPAFFFFANPNLQPEKSKGYDVGFEQPVWNDRVRFGLTYFHNDITDLINGTFDPVTFISSLGNVDQAKTYGYEAFVSGTVNDRLRLRADYTYTKAIDELTKLDLLRRPNHKYSVTAIWNPMDKLAISATAIRFASWADVDRSTFLRTTGDAYTLVNVAANYNVNGHVTAFARVDNLLNQKYENPSGFLHPGFGIYGGVRVSN